MGLVGVPSSFPGPSEVVVVADETTPADLAAIDLIVQIEHGPDGLAWLITWSEEAADRILSAVSGLVADAPRRDVIEANLASNCYVALVDGRRGRDRRGQRDRAGAPPVDVRRPRVVAADGAPRRRRLLRRLRARQRG